MTPLYYVHHTNPINGLGGKTAEVYNVEDCGTVSKLKEILLEILGPGVVVKALRY